MQITHFHMSVIHAILVGNLKRTRNQGHFYKLVVQMPWAFLSLLAVLPPAPMMMMLFSLLLSLFLFMTHFAAAEKGSCLACVRKCQLPEDQANVQTLLPAMRADTRAGVVGRLGDAWSLLLSSWLWTSKGKA